MFPSSVAERSFKSYRLTMVKPKNSHKGNKLLDLAERKYSTKMRLISH